jgi:hypothetical protein
MQYFGFAKESENALFLQPTVYKLLFIFVRESGMLSDNGYTNQHTLAGCGIFLVFQG